VAAAAAKEAKAECLCGKCRLSAGDPRASRELVGSRL
jgi:hypothetical protein